MKIIYISFFIFLFTSCAKSKDFIYFQGNSDNNEPTRKTSVTLKPDDLLSVLVFGAEEESLKLFNFPSSATNNRGYTSGSPIQNGYLINSQGEIDFPLIGKIKLTGLNIEEATELIKTEIQTYLKSPIVSIQIQNFKITILGDVKNPGTIQIPNDRFTLIQALGVAGDLNISALRKNILVIREENNIKKEYRIDLTSKAILNSPVYYVNQNDIIYIEANKSKINSSVVSSAAGVFISVASLLITTKNVLSK